MLLRSSWPLSKKIIVFLLCFAMIFALFGLPAQAHALGAELAATLGMGTSLGAVAPVVLTILLAAGLGVAAANVTPRLIEWFYSRLDSSAKADIDTMASAYNAEVSNRVTSAASSGQAVNVEPVNIQLTQPVKEAVKDFVQTTSYVDQATSYPAINSYNFDKVFVDQLELSAIGGTFSANVNSTATQNYRVTFSTGISIGGTPFVIGFRTNLSGSGSTAKIVFQPALFDTAGHLISYSLNDYVGSGFYLPKADGVGITSFTFDNVTRTTTAATADGVSFIVYNYIFDAVSNLGTSVKMRFPVVASASLPNQLAKPTNLNTHSAPYTKTNSPGFLPSGGYTNGPANLYPYVSAPAGNISDIPATDIISVNPVYTPSGTFQDYVSSDPLADNTVIAVPVPNMGIEEGVAIPTDTAEEWSDVVINLSPDDVRTEQVVPPVDVGDDLTWPTTQAPTIDITDSSTWPLDWSPDQVSDIAGDTTLDPDLEGNWWPKLFRIPILGQILQLLYLLWQLLSSLLNTLLDFFRNLFQHLFDWFKSVFDALKAIWTRLGDILQAIGRLIVSLPATLLDIFLLISGYTLFQELLDGFLPTVVVSVLWVFWMAALAIWLVRWLADR